MSYQPSPGYQQDYPKATTILVLGILSLVLCQILGPVAWVMGNTGLREIDASGGAYGGRTLVQVGRICGMIATALIILGLVILVFAVIAGLATGD